MTLDTKLAQETVQALEGERDKMKARLAELEVIIAVARQLNYRIHNGISLTGVVCFRQVCTSSAVIRLPGISGPPLSPHAT